MLTRRNRLNRPLRPILDELDDLSDIRTFTINRARPQIITMKAIFGTLLATRCTIAENGAVIEIAKKIGLDCQGAFA
jgi:hypothetical protein